MQREQAAVQNKEHVFAFAICGANAAAFGESGYMGRSLRLCRDGVEDMNAPDAPALNERPKRAHNGFNFWQFRHSAGIRGRA